MTRLQTILAVALLGVLFSAPAAMAQTAENHIQYRQKVMGSVGANWGAINDIMKNNLAAVGNIADHAKIISMNAKMAPGAFKQEAAEGKTDAKPAIWKEWSKFEENAKKLESASAKLAEVAATGDKAAIGEGMKAVGGACKGCHDDFRKPQAESYKTAK